MIKKNINITMSIMVILASVLIYFKEIKNKDRHHNDFKFNKVVIV